MKSKTYMLLVVGLLLIFITSVSAAPPKLPASSKTPAGQQKPVANPQSITPTAVQPVGGTLTITSISPYTVISGMPTLTVGSNTIILWNASQISSSITLRLTLLRNSAPIGDIAYDLYAPFGKYVWEVGKGTGPAITAFGPGYSIRLCTSDNSKCTVSGQFAISSASPLPSGISQSVPSLTSGAYQAVKPFALTAPNGGESWSLGSTHDITWSPGDVGGNVRLDLYEGSTEPANRVGVITGNTPAATGKYSWKVGGFLGGEAAVGEGYLVVVSSYTPEKKDASNATFSIVPVEPRAASVKKAVSATSTNGISTASIKSISLTYPRRADELHKGTGYNITWKSAGIPGVKLMLQLLKNDGSTIVETIGGGDIPNNGQIFWAVPSTLPDAKTFYKMRIQTMEGEYSDIVGPFSITKAVKGPDIPAIAVVSPGGPTTPGAGITLPIRWTINAPCNTSPNEPTVDGFNIYLIAGSKIVKLLDGEMASYDGESPAAFHNWHWDWQIPLNQPPQTYQIRVTNVSGKCTGMSKPFDIVAQPAPLLERR